MGTVGKIIAALIVASTVQACTDHIVKTVKMRKEAKQ